MTVKYTTAAIVQNALAGISIDIATSVIEEYINQNEAYVDAFIMRDSTFSFSTSKQGHLLLRKLVTNMTVMDVALANMSKNTLDTIRTLYDAANDTFIKIQTILKDGAVRDWIKEQ